MLSTEGSGNQVLMGPREVVTDAGGPWQAFLKERRPQLGLEEIDQPRRGWVYSTEEQRSTPTITKSCHLLRLSAKPYIYFTSEETEAQSSQGHMASQ